MFNTQDYKSNLVFFFLTNFIFVSSNLKHKEKTKEITTVTVVWIPDLNWHKILRTFALNFSKNYKWFEKPCQKLERVFHQVSEHLEVG